MHPTLFALRRAYNAARTALEVSTREQALTLAQLEVLKHLAPSKSGVDQRALQAELGVTSATLTTVLGGMTKRKLITRVAHLTDGRGKIVILTPAGRALFKSFLRNTEDEYNARFLRGFSEHEVASLTTLLERLADNLTD
jgi:DNA-binding MarR family transcriptional regulator